jgi:hypothetical protein
MKTFARFSMMAIASAITLDQEASQLSLISNFMGQGVSNCNISTIE